MIRLETRIAARIARCFDLMRSVDIHTQSTAQSGERAVASVPSSLLQQGDEVTWEAVLDQPDRAGNQGRTRILADPTGILRSLQRRVARGLARQDQTVGV